MRTSFHHASATRKTSASVVLELAAGGCVGYGECAPRQYVTGETIASVRVGLETWWRAHFKSLNSLESREGVTALRERLAHGIGLPHGPNERCALDLALKDLSEKLDGAPSNEQPQAFRAPFTPVCDGVGRWSVNKELLAKVPRVKLKTARTMRELVERVRKTRDLTDAEIIVDANNDWNADHVLDRVKVLLEAGVSWFEEPAPVRDWSTLREVRRTGAKVLLDESCCNIEDLERAFTAYAVDGINVRVAKLGGPAAAQVLVGEAKGRDIGRYYGVQVAEVGTLIPAGRQLALTDEEALGVESGQSDLFFDAAQLWTSVVTPDRQEITVSKPSRLAGRRGHDSVRKVSDIHD